MRKKALILVFTSTLCSLCMGQSNLVPNPGFDTFSSCPNNIGQLALASPWYSPTMGTPDYFNLCGSASVSIPGNAAGNQSARSGVGYAGFYVFNSGFPNDGREYIEVQLSDTLEWGKKYLVSFYLSLADNMQYRANTLGAYFSQNSISGPCCFNLPYTPQIENPINNSLNDKNNWMLVSDTLFASGNELHMTIGNFRPDSLSDTLFLGNGNVGWNYAYYYIDDVSVIDIGWVGIEESSFAQDLSIYPNPANNYINVVLNLMLSKKTTLRITDAIGNEIMHHIIESQTSKISLPLLPNGMYFVSVEKEEGTVLASKKIVIIN